MGNQILIPYFYPTYYQMTWMFNGATAFNQDLCHFGDNWPYSRVRNMFFDAITQMSRQVHLDRGALLQLVLRTSVRIRKSVFCEGGRVMRSIHCDSLLAILGSANSNVKAIWS